MINAVKSTMSFCMHNCANGYGGARVTILGYCASAVLLRMQRAIYLMAG